MTTVTASEREYSMGLSRTSMPAGRYVFVARNKGTTTHALGIKGPGVDRTTDDIAPGGSSELTVTLVKGSYDVYCPISDHQAMGMDVHITVS